MNPTNLLLSFIRQQSYIYKLLLTLQINTIKVCFKILASIYKLNSALVCEYD